MQMEIKARRVIERRIDIDIPGASISSLDIGEGNIYGCTAAKADLIRIRAAVIVAPENGVQNHGRCIQGQNGPAAGVAGIAVKGAVGYQRRALEAGQTAPAGSGQRAGHRIAGKDAVGQDGRPVVGIQAATEARGGVGGKDAAVEGCVRSVAGHPAAGFGSIVFKTAA